MAISVPDPKTAATARAATTATATVTARADQAAAR
jgi:hypothetical protein